MAPPSNFSQGEARRATLKLNLDTLDVLLGQNTTTPLDEATARDSLQLARDTQKQLIENHEWLTTYAANEAALQPYADEYPTQLSRALRIASGFRGIVMNFPSTTSTAAAAAAATTHSTPNDMRLPRLQIPMFSGNLEEWISFRDMFEKAIVNNAALSKAQKLTYLKSYLSGEAARHVSTLVISDANYDVAWSTLTNRYQNERELLFSILRRLMNQPNHTTPSAAALRNMIDTTQGCIRSLEVISVPVQHWDAVIIYTLFNKLDPMSRELWEQSLADSKIPTLKSLTDFLEQRARALAAGSSSQSTMRGKPDRNRPVQAHHGQAQPSNQRCPFNCQTVHPLFRCPKFNDLSVPKRLETVKKNSLCFNCFGSGHGATTCQSKHSCRLCGKRHHSMIHQQREEAPPSEVPTSSVSSHHADDNSTIGSGILATARVQVLNCYGEPMYFRVLLDGGSPVSFIEEACAKKLRLPLNSSTTVISGIGGASAGTSQATTSFVIKPHFKSKVTYTVRALVLKKITSRIPSAKMSNSSWSHLDDLRLADPDYDSPAPVDILIGSDLFWTIVQMDKISGPADSPYAIRSTLGWLVAGQSQRSTKEISSFTINLNLEETVQRFWEAETVPSIPLLSKEENECEEFFSTTHTRQPNGRFCVSIPWKSPRPPLGSSRPQALQRLFQLERRFHGTKIKDAEKLRQLQQHKDDYIAFMREYQQLGHMEEVPSNEINDQSVYISHHFVLKELSSTTRLRVVFDASAKTSSGFSLNDAMMVGPTLQDPIQDILIRFRKHNIAFTADIAKMYRQIKVRKEDQDSQRILWRENPSSPVKDYRLTTVTYGTASAPYNAVKCLQQLALMEKDEFPLAAPIALSDFYVDDAASGCGTVPDAIKTIQQLRKMCIKGGFPLRKWSCNNNEVLQSIPEDQRETTTLVQVDNYNPIKTLGIYWDPKDDKYLFKITLPKSTDRCTKRTMLSEISMIFDPIGWLSPTILLAKLLIQELWRTKCDWDDEVPPEIETKWKQLKMSLPNIEKIKIPRCIIPGDPIKTVLCGFSDASTHGYSACLYSLCYYNGREPYATLITSKTKVAPLSSLTIPRLELNGALLLATLMKSTIRALKYTFDDVRAYTDSTIVLAWINSSPLRWKTYVRQRVQKINDCIPEARWYHVRSEDNPADCASRGVQPDELVHHTLWWTGNAAMQHDEVPSSATFDDNLLSSVQHEEQKFVNVHHVMPDEMTVIIQRFSSFQRLQRVIAWNFRFVNNIRSPSQTQFGPLSVPELQHSSTRLLSFVQRAVFPEYNALVADGKISSTSKLLSLSPFVDSSGLMRVGGRLKNAKINPDKKNPILLPTHHPITKMIIADYHEKYFHAGPQLMLSLLQQRFWIPRARDTIRFQLKKCPTCIRYRGETMKQFMGELPAERVNPSHPFSKCGVDYAGPILTRPPVRSKVTLKSYLAIFVCLATRALHIEVVESLSTDSFLAALRRFTSRRGRPTDIFSDCGSNFVGANRAIKEIIMLCRSTTHNEKVTDALSSEGIQWHFNPPNSPHFGGLWEAGVRSIKYHINRVMGSSRFTYEELLTLVTQIEALLNSRPLVPASTDPCDLQALTPAHLLNGCPLTTIPEPDLGEINEGRLSRWQHIQQQKQHFWRRWSREYITRLQQRPKWMRVQQPLKLNDMVIIKDDNLPPSKWNLGRIIAVHPGSDGIIRVATVKTAHGEYKRAIHKLCLLPMEQQPSPPPESIS